MSTSLDDCRPTPGTTRNRRDAQGCCEDCTAFLTAPMELCRDCCEARGHGEADSYDECSWCGQPGISERRASFHGMALYDGSKS